MALRAAAAVSCRAPGRLLPPTKAVAAAEEKRIARLQCLRTGSTQQIMPRRRRQKSAQQINPHAQSQPLSPMPRNSSRNRKHTGRRRQRHGRPAPRRALRRQARGAGRLDRSGHRELSRSAAPITGPAHVLVRDARRRRPESGRLLQGRAAGRVVRVRERPNCKVRVGDLATGLDVDKKTWPAATSWSPTTSASRDGLTPVAHPGQGPAGRLRLPDATTSRLPWPTEAHRCARRAAFSFASTAPG